jgi:hypothetical protein
LPPCRTSYCGVIRTATLSINRQDSDSRGSIPGIWGNFHALHLLERLRGPPSLLVSEYRDAFSEAIASRAPWNLKMHGP